MMMSTRNRNRHPEERAPCARLEGWPRAHVAILRDAALRAAPLDDERGV
jgi:hypothetical protein